MTARVPPQNAQGSPVLQEKAHGLFFFSVIKRFAKIIPTEAKAKLKMISLSSLALAESLFFNVNILTQNNFFFKSKTF